MQVGTQARPERRTAAGGRAPPTPGAAPSSPATGDAQVARGVTGEAAGPLGAALARSVAARANLRGAGCGEALLQRVLSFTRQREREALPKKYVETAVADFEKLRVAVAALRQTAATSSTNVAAWLNGELDPVSAFITSRDDKPVPFVERNEVVDDIEKHTKKLGTLRKALPGKVAEDVEQRRTGELGRADTIEARIAKGEQERTDLGEFLTTSELEAILASAGKARTALGAARGVLGESPDLVKAGSELTGAESDVAALERVVAGGAQRKEYATRHAAVVKAVEALKRPRPKERMAEQLLLVAGLSPEQQIASLSDVAIPGGVAALEAELAAAQDVDTSFSTFIDGAQLLGANKLFSKWVKAEFPKLKPLTWEQLVISNGDPSADPGLKRLLKGLEHAKLAVPRLNAIGADIDKLKLVPLKTHLKAMEGKVAASWTEQLADLSALEDALKFAREVEQRRADAIAALPALTHQTQRSNIEGWLRDNEALTFAEQQDGVATTRLKGGLNNIEARISMYNESYRLDRAAAVQAEKDRVAHAAAEKLRKAAEKAATQRVLTAGDPSVVLVDLLSKAEIWQGAITETYKSSYDSGLGEFSAEVRIGGLKDIVIHAHCAADGRPKPGNAVHWKELRYKHLTGPTYSHPVPDSLRPHLLDATRMKSNRDANSKINWR